MEIEIIQVVLESTEKQLVSIGGQGPKGADGRNGIDGSGALALNFSFGDATPALITTAPAGKMVYRVELYIDEVFDGVGAEVTVGDAGNPARLMNASENDLTQVCANETNPGEVYGTDTGIILSITPGSGATQGSGIVLVYIQS